jgi:5-methylcytosine-specific restriction endonuclease McrA
MNHKQPKQFDELTCWPKQSSAAFHIWKYHGFAQYYHWEDDTDPELMLFTPILITAWHQGLPVRFEFTLAMQSAKSRAKAWFFQLHSPSSVLQGNAMCGLDIQSSLMNDGAWGHCGILPESVAPKLACEWRNTIIEAARGLETRTTGYVFCYGEVTSKFSIFTLCNESVGPAIVPNGQVITEKLANWLCPEKAKRPKTSRNVKPKLRRSILERDGYQCVDCGRNPRNDPSCVLHVDHRIAIAKGGSNRPSNLQTLCDWCNIGKHTDPDWKLKAVKL